MGNSNFRNFLKFWLCVGKTGASSQFYVEIREIDPLSVIVPISKIRKPHLPIGLNIWNTLYRADVPSKKWFRIVFREDQPSTKEQPEGAREPE